MNKNSNSQTKSGQKTKAAKAHGPVQRDSKEGMAELVAKLSERLGPKPAKEKAGEGKPKGAPGFDRDRLTVGVDLGDQWSNYCILGLEGETLAEGQLRTTREDVAEFFRALSAARVIFEVGTHSAWVREVVVGCGHKDGRHVGLDFYDLLIEGVYRLRVFLGDVSVRRTNKRSKASLVFARLLGDGITKEGRLISPCLKAGALRRHEVMKR